MLSENLLYDPHYNMMSVQARELFVRLLIKTDDFGVIPGEDYTLGAILNLDEYQKKHLEELIGEMENAGLLKGFIYQDKPYLMMKRDRFDEYQAYVVRNRTQSEYLRVKTEDLEDSNKLQEITGNYWKFHKGYTLSHREIKDIRLETKVIRLKKKKVFYEFSLESIPKELIAKAGFDEAWGEWVNHRKELNKPLTLLAVKKQFDFLKQQPDPVIVLTNSIQNGWQGLFEIKENGNGRNRKTNSASGANSKGFNDIDLGGSKYRYE